MKDVLFDAHARSQRPAVLSNARPAPAMFQSTCGCCASRRDFIELVNELSIVTRDGHWTRVAPFTHPFQWTCRADAIQRTLLSANSIGNYALDRTEKDSTSGKRAIKPKQKNTSRARDSADLVILNARIFTGDSANKWCEALAVRDGKIIKAASSAEVSSMIDSSTIVVRANGRTVIPGFNDAHMHHTPDPKGIRLPFDPNLDPTREEMNELLREAAGASAEGTWILGTLNERLINDRGFDRFAIDAIAPHHPVIFLGLTNHTNVVNTAAMHLLGISEEEPDALGGFYERVRGLRQVSGRIHEYAQWSPQRCLASMATIEEGAKSLRALSDECVRLGITTVQNMSWTPVARYLDMLKSAELPIKVRVIRFPPSGPQGRLLSEGAGIATDVGDRISLSGTKWILDGTPVERASALGRPYADDPTIQGRENFAPGEVEKMIREALVADDQLILHAIGTQTLETVIKTLEDFHPRGNWGDRGLRIEHADGLNHDQIARLRSLGVMVVQNPSHFLFANIYAPRFGTDTLYASFATLLDSGIPLGIGSDGPLNPFLGLFAAVTHPARPDEACTIEQAVVAYTAGSAAAEDKSTIKGRLIPGFEADIAILSHDIFSIDATELAETRSLLTIVDGRIVHCSDEEMLQSSDD